MVKSMKQFTALMLIAAVLLGAVSCQGKTSGHPGGDVSGQSETSGEESTEKIPEEEKVTLNTFDLGIFMEKYWEGSTVYHESIGFVEDNDGSIRSGELMYMPDSILSVRSSDLQQEYQEGADYVVEGKRIVLTENSAIQPFPNETYSPHYADSKTDWLKCSKDSTRYIAVDGSVRQHQIAVTYTHSDSWTGTIPQSEIDRLPKTKNKLENKEALNIVFYGDSITAGWEASGVDEYPLDVNTLQEFHFTSNTPPYCPAWASLVTQQLRKAYGYDDITYVNRGAGGSYSVWGKNNAAALVNPCKPDLVVIAFGMNQVGTSGKDIAADVLSIIQTVAAENPDCEYVIVSCMEANTECASFFGHQLAAQEKAYYDLRDKETDYAIAIAPVHTMFADLYANGKIYIDITGNNLNHPNDFSIRMYAQTIAAVLGA